MKVVILGFSAKHKRIVRELLAEHTTLKVTKHLLWVQELVHGLNDCAVLKKRTVLSYPEISVEQGMREVDLLKANQVFVIYVKTKNRSMGALILNEQARINKDLISVTLTDQMVESDKQLVIENLRKKMSTVWKKTS